MLVVAHTYDHQLQLYFIDLDSRRASMIRRKAPGPYVDIAGPTVLTVILMLSIVTQFSIKLYTLMWCWDDASLWFWSGYALLLD